jgi:phospholipid/cholesterol/gamma-HCH transport system substrate-binding protein
MEKNKLNRIRLGLFVTLGLALLIAGTYFIGKKQQMFNSTFMIRGIFKDVSGLQVGNNVRFTGINVGIVSNIEIITDTSVLVLMSIDQKVQKFIKTDAQAIIGSDGLMGNKILIIFAGQNSSKTIRANDFITTRVPLSMDDILLRLKVTVDNAAIITTDMAKIFSNISKGRGTIGKLFMDSSFANNLDKTLENVRDGAGGFKQNMDAASHSIFLRGYLKDKDKVKEDEKKKMIKENEEKQKLLNKEKALQEKQLKKEKKEAEKKEDTGKKKWFFW